MQKSSNTFNRNDKSNQLDAFMSAYFNLLVLGLSFLILIVGFLFFILPKYQQADKRIEQVNKELEAKYLSLEKYYQKLLELNENYRNVDQGNTAKIRQFLPDQPGVEELIKKMEFITRSNGIILSSLDVDGGEKRALAPGELPPESSGPTLTDIRNRQLPDGVRPIRISMSLVGVSYQGMKNFLNSLELSLRLMDITELKYSPGDGSLNIVLSTYYLK